MKQEFDGRATDKDREDETGRRESFYRKRARPPADLSFDYKDPESLRPFITESGKIVPARVSRLSRKQQLQLSREVKRARSLALLFAPERRFHS